MKRNISLLAAMLLTFAAHLPAQESMSAELVMRKVADKLALVKQLGYKYTFEYSVPSRESSTVVRSIAFLDLKPVDGASQFRFQFVSDDRSDMFNGTERFILDRSKVKLYVDNKPSFKSFGNISLQNSPLSLKYALPKIAANNLIQKKVSLIRSGERDQYLLEFSLTKAIINSAGDIMETGADLTNIFRLKVDASTLLPVEVIQTNDKDDELLKTTFAEATETPAAPAESSWYFSTYQKEYTLQKTERLTLIEPGKIAPVFSLDAFEKASKVSFDHFKGKLVLLEFWIAHCGFCIAAVPKLNGLYRKYAKQGVELVSINMYDPAATIESFKKRNKPEFAILTGGDSMAAQYGVDAYPAIVLIDRSGKVIYSSSGLFEKELEAAINANLKE